MKYYLGGYYFMKLRSANFGSWIGAKICTCSTYINDSYFDAWSISWSSSGKSGLKEAKEEFNLTSLQIKEIQSWADHKFEEKKIGWICTFSDFATLSEYKSIFFNTAEDYHIFSINFPEIEKDELIEEFLIKEKEIGAIGLCDNLQRQIPEVTDGSEKVIGYDLIGIEQSGDFHSFHCHDLSSSLVEKFNVQINQYGLIDNNHSWESLVKYMNDEENGFEPVPWFFVKVKMVEEKKKASA
ncbi:hypothetical protein [Rufibacter immobilis]|uniref:hypothetical protein n=1 Tax=Rufibacter immobilis TaxID=1348778 RepID=UPI0035E4EB5F